jgi:DNA polymerase-3 subunit epsilon
MSINNFGGLVVNQGVRWWAEAVLRQGIAIWDIESTGMTAKDRVIEIGLVDAQTGAYLLSSFIKTDAPIHPKAQEIHNITEAMLLNAPAFEKVALAVNKILNGRDSATYNAAFDTRLWAQSGESFPGKIWCLMEAYKLYAGLPKKIRLASACEQMGVNEKNTHRALADARAAAGLLRAMALGIVPNVDTVLQLASVEVNPAADNDFVMPPPEKRVLSLT